MPSRPLLLSALAALATIGVATPAAACAAPCAPPVVAKAPAPAYVQGIHVRRHARRVHVKRYVKPIYIVDQGPVYGGPAIVTAPRIEPFNTPPARYPVMRESYYYPTYRDRYTVAPWHRP